MFTTNRKIVKSSLVNTSDSAASKEKNGVLNRAVFAKGDSWKT